MCYVVCDFGSGKCIVAYLTSTLRSYGRRTVKLRLYADTNDRFNMNDILKYLAVADLVRPAIHKFVRSIFFLYENKKNSNLFYNSYSPAQLK